MKENWKSKDSRSDMVKSGLSYKEILNKELSKRKKLIERILQNEGGWCDFCNREDAVKIKKIEHHNIVFHICENCLKNTCEQFWDDDGDA